MEKTFLDGLTGCTYGKQDIKRDILKEKYAE